VLHLSGPSRPTPRLPSNPAPIARTGERRYTEEELALILNRAAERQEGMEPSVPRYSLADIQEIAAGAGIAPDHVASVAATLRDARAPRASGIFGAPWRFRFEESIEGEVDDDVVAELFDLVRRELGVQGEVSEALGTLEWKAQDSFGWTYATVARRGGRTTIAVQSAHSDAIAGIATFGGVGAIFGSGGLGTALVSFGLAGPIAGLAGILGGTGVSYLAARLIWRRLARRAGDRTDGLGVLLVAAARRAVAEGRVMRG
jgi:hypothetical protein